MNGYLWTSVIACSVGVVACISLLRGITPGTDGWVQNITLLVANSVLGGMAAGMGLARHLLRRYRHMDN